VFQIVNPPLEAGGRRHLSLLTAALKRNQHLAIATTTYRGNIDALLAAALGNDWAKSFAAIVASDEVFNKKPAPDVYLEVLSRLNWPLRSTSRLRIPASVWLRRHALEFQFLSHAAHIFETTISRLRFLCR
jgi:hypothetical protein